MSEPLTPYMAVVEWNDAHGDASKQVWSLDSSNHAPLVIQTLGWVTREDKVGVTMFTERIENADGSFAWRGSGFIPRGMVVSVTDLTPKAKAPRKRK
jgi:hypothetical protein